MKRSEIFEKISIILVKQLNVEKSEIVPSADLKKDLGANSLDILVIGIDVEREFKIELQDEEMGKISDVKSLTDLVEKKLQN